MISLAEVGKISQHLLTHEYSHFGTEASVVSSCRHLHSPPASNVTRSFDALKPGADFSVSKVNVLDGIRLHYNSVSSTLKACLVL